MTSAPQVAAKSSPVRRSERTRCRAPTRWPSASTLPPGSGAYRAEPAPGEDRGTLQRRCEAAPEAENDGDEDRAGDDAGRFGHARKRVLEQQDDRRADAPAPERPHATEHRHKHRASRRRPVQKLERREAVTDGEERTRETGDAAGHHERDELVTLRGITEGLRPRLVVADRHEPMAKGRTDDAS